MATNRCKMLDLNNAKKLLESVDIILCDCDGVLWKTDEVIPGGPSCIEKIKAMGKKVFYVTNNSNKSRKENVQKFLKMGYHVVDDEIFCASYVAAEYLKTKQKYQGKVIKPLCLNNVLECSLHRAYKMSSYSSCPVSR